MSRSAAEQFDERAHHMIFSSLASRVNSSWGDFLIGGINEGDSGGATTVGDRLRTIYGYKSKLFFCPSRREPMSALLDGYVRTKTAYAASGRQAVNPPPT